MILYLCHNFLDDFSFIFFQDIDVLRGKLQNVNDYFRVNYTQFTHLDFLFAIDARELVYNRIFEALKQF